MSFIDILLSNYFILRTFKPSPPKIHHSSKRTKWIACATTSIENERSDDQTVSSLTCFKLRALLTIIGILGRPPSRKPRTPRLVHNYNNDNYRCSSPRTLELTRSAELVKYFDGPKVDQ